MKKRLFFFFFLISTLTAISAYGVDHTQYSDLPTLYIETANSAPIPSKNEDYIRAVLTLVDGDKTVVYDELGIRGRGNSTWNLAKKPYRIKFDSKQEFLGKDHAKAKSWTLLANHSDKTLMRNAVAACIGSFAGQPFTAAAKFVDVVLNGQYIGNYQISDHVEVRKKRVDITEQEDEGMTENDNISGGYLLEVDGFAYQEKSYFTTKKGVMITIKSPDEDIISKAQTNYISNYINNFETALFSSDFKDPEKGYRPYVDAETLASWYIASELTGNPDCFWSTYIYKEKDDPKIYWGPLWDYDIAFNNCYRKGDMANRLMSDYAFGDELAKIWVKQMWLDPWFANLINDKWKSLVAAGIEQHILDFIDDTASMLQQSQKLNFGIWSIRERTYDEFRLFNTYDEGVEYLKNYVSNRVGFLTTAFEQAAAAITPPEPFEADPLFYYTITNKAVSKLADVSEGWLCIWQSDEARQSQYWRFVPDGKGNYMIVNKETGLAVSVDSPGTVLVLDQPDIENQSQLWSIAPASNSPGMGMIIANCKNGLAWNNSAGSSNDGNDIIMWDNDALNPDKPNRQWYIKITGEQYVVEPSSIGLNKSSTTLLEGTADILYATVEPDEPNIPEINWSSDNPSVATVDDSGRIVALSAGEADITVTCGNVTAKCRVDVKEIQNVESTSGLLLTLRVGQEADFELNLEPEIDYDPMLRWSLDDEESEFVDMVAIDTNSLSASFAGKSIGETGFTVYLPENNKPIFSGRVNVIAENPVESIVLDPNDFSLAEGAAPIEIYASLTPADVTYPEVVWSVEPDGIVELSEKTDTSVLVTPLQEGEATITATTVDGTGVTADCKVDIIKVTAIELNVADGNEDRLSDNNLKMYVGLDLSLKVTTTPPTDFGPELAWTIDDKKVASFEAYGSEAKVTGIAVGETDLLVSLAQDETISAGARVYVYPDASVTHPVVGDSPVDVYNIAGQPVLLHASPEQLESLPEGFYIIHGDTVGKFFRK